MNLFGFEVCSTLVKVGIALVIVGFLTIVSLIKFYAYVTCGYCRSRTRMDGKTVIVTGATGGIGKETAKDLAKRGARVILACRNTDYANSVKDEIIKETGNEKVIVKKLDLSTQKSIREFAEDINKTEPKLHVLIHNAGTAEMWTKTTEDDLELTMATNHFGPFLLTHLLIDLLKKTGNARIVIVASELYRLANINLSNLNPVNTYFPVYLYYVSKYANIVFCKELARRLTGTGVTANCLHPGMIDTGIYRAVPWPLSWGLLLIIKFFFKTPYQGCQTTVYAAVSEEVEGISGKYFMDCKERDVANGCKSESKAKKLWELSEKFCNLKPTDPKI